MSDPTDTDATRLVPEQARQAQAELIEALGTEHRDGQWMTFMTAVERWIPEEVFNSSGRPNRQQIERSPIGQLGFSSWKELLTSDREAGGLGLPWSRWKEYRRSWSVVREHPWLRECDVSASAVKQLAERVRKTGAEFPESYEEWEQFEADRQEQAEQDRAESVKALKEQVADLEQRLEDAESRASRYRRQAMQRRAREREAVNRADKAEAGQKAALAKKAEIEQARKEADQRREEAEKDAKKARSDRDKARQERDQARSMANRSVFKIAWQRLFG